MKEITDTLKREFRTEYFGFQYEHPKKFTRCQWQTGPGASLWYMLYRWAVFLYFLVTLTLNIWLALLEDFRLGRPSKWFLYMTYWGYTLCTLQCLLAAWLLTRSWWLQGKLERVKRPREMTLSLQIYWLLHTTALDMAISITSIFWVAIYNPAEHKLDFLTLDNHVLNSVVMGVDFILLSHPMRLLHCFYPVVFLVSYFLFSIVHFWLGGVQIYAVLDWQRPLRTSAICFSAVCYLLFAHVSLWVLHHLRRWMSDKLGRDAQIPEEVKTRFIENSEV